MTQQKASKSTLTKRTLALQRHIFELKRSERRGWTRRGVPKPESIADHVCGVSLLALVMARDRGLSVEKTVTMALIHELCEAITGDIIPADGVTPDEKRRLETEASRKILDDLDETGELYELWLEFEHERSPEGRLVKQLDRLEMALQAAAYERASDLDLQEFFDSARHGIADPELLDVLDEVEMHRQEGSES